MSIDQLPHIAIIIPTLNEERFIEACLTSLYQQSYPIDLMDVMVVDGGSQDQTITIVNQWATAHPNLRLLINPKKIQSAAFNVGCNASTAPYIIRLDAHALYHSNYILLCVQHLVETPMLGNIGGICIIKPKDDSLIASANAILNKSRFGIGGAAFRVANTAMEVDSVPFGAFPRKVINEIGGMREDLVRAEDNEYNSRIRKAGYKVFLDPAIQSTYFSRSTIKESVKQMYSNGLSIGILCHLDRQAVGLRHLVPLTFVTSLILCAGIGLFVPLAGYFGLLILSLYVLCAIVASAILSKQYGKRYFFVLPILFFCVHIAYGWGTIVGLIKSKY